jgi:hypothetical protein
LLPAVIGFGALVLKASLDPLAGLDTKFRWNFLALQMLHEASLHFYPAVNAEDFLHYGWCDGIAPLVSGLYFWAYLSAGHTAPWATSPIVIAQAALLFYVVYELASRRAGPAAGCTAMAILTTSCIFVSGVSIGQETGLTALSLVAMFWFIERHRDAPYANWLMWAGIAAGTGGLAREYGLAFVALGGLMLARQGVSFRAWLSFILPATISAGPWYLRNWLKTGNPLYSHELHGLFPANPINTEYIRTTNGILGFDANPHALGTLAILLAALAGVPIALGLIGSLKHRRELWPWFAASVVMVALWLWSVGQTSGGYTYSLRVLTPALALSAVFGGLAFARWAGSQRSWLLAALLTVPAIDAAERVLFMPIDSRIDWWREAPTAWLKIRDRAIRWDNDPNWAAVADAADGRQIMVIDPFSHALLVGLGAKPVPFFSPAVRFLFEPGANYAACLTRLREGGMRFILLSAQRDIISNRQLSRHPFFAALQATHPAAATSSYFAYDLYSPEINHPVASEALVSTPHAP